MTQEQKDIKKYVNAIERHLKVDLAMKARINSDLATDIHARLESGESFADIRSSLGTAKAVAAGFNEELQQEQSSASKWRFVFLILGLIFCGLLLYNIASTMLLGFISKQASAIGIIGGADGPTAIYVTSSFPMLIRILSFLSLSLAAIGGYILLRQRITTKKAVLTAGLLSLLGLAATLILILDISALFAITPMLLAPLVLLFVCIYKLIKMHGTTK